MQPDTYEIEMGSFREDYNIYYYEPEKKRPVRKLVAAVDVRNNFLFKPTAILYLNTFERWDVNGEQLVLSEYILILKRVYNFLKSKGFKVELSINENIWPNSVESVIDILKGT